MTKCIGSLDSIGLDLFNLVFNTTLKPKIIQSIRINVHFQMGLRPKQYPHNIRFSSSSRSKSSLFYLKIGSWVVINPQKRIEIEFRTIYFEET